MNGSNLNFGPPERVHVEGEWFDGPRGGVGDINGVPHRFQSLFDVVTDDFSSTFVIWPIEAEALKLEVEQWQIFVAWNLLYEAGEAGTESHPGNGGINARWDEIDAQLKKSRSEAPASAKRAHAEFVRICREHRYEPEGPDYCLRWCVL